MNRSLFSFSVSVLALGAVASNPAMADESKKKIRTAKAVYVVVSGRQVDIPVAGKSSRDEYGNFKFEPTKIQNFEIVVGPESTKAGCVPAAKADGLKSWSDVRSTEKDVVAATKLGTKKFLAFDSDKEESTAHQFEVNEGKETAVTHIRVFFPFQKQYEQCGFMVNLFLSGEPDEVIQSAPRKSEDGKEADTETKDSPAPPPPPN